MSPLTIAELAGSAEYGGGERYLELLFDRLDRTRFRPLLICPEPGPFVEIMRGRGVPARIIHLAPLVNPLALFRLVRLLAREQVTILQTHGARSSAYGQVAGRLAGVPIIVSTVHNSLLDYPIGSLKRWLYLTVLRRTMRLADRIICVSEDLRQHVHGDLQVAANKTVTVHNGIDITRFHDRPARSTIRNEFGVGDAPLLVSIGRLTEQKGHRYLLAALPSLLATWPELRCLIIGEGELGETLKNLAVRLGVASTCVFVGARPDIPVILAAADLLVLPSVSEGFPFVLLEALAMGRPVVASRVNGVPELIEDRKTGRLVPPRDSQALARVIRELLLDPPQAAAMGEQGRRVVQERFTADGMVAQTVALFESVLGERTGRVSEARGISA